MNNLTIAGAIGRDAETRPSGFTRPDDMDAKRRRWKRIAAGGRA